MIITVSPSSSLVRPLLISVVALAAGIGATPPAAQMPAQAPELRTDTQPSAGRSAVLAFPSADGRADVGIGLVVDADDRIEGLLLLGVRAGSPWALAGLQDGDVIVRVDGGGVGNLPHVLDALTRHPNHTIAFARDAQVRTAWLQLQPGS